MTRAGGWVPVNAGRRSGNDSGGPTTTELKWFWRFFAFSVAVVATMMKCRQFTCEKIYSSRKIAWEDVLSIMFHFP
jgi:hypothetical protein